MPFTNNPNYVSGSIGVGSVVEVISGGTYVLENVTINRPAKVISRLDEMGRENGWTLIKGQPCSGSATLQVGTIAAIPPNGAFFSDTFTGTNVEKWVIVSQDQPIAHDTYWKVNIGLKLDYVTYPPNY
jgi:hypothetical protein